MNRFQSLFTASLFLSTAAFAGETLDCRAHVPNGTDLHFAITDGTGTRPGYNDSLFGGIGQGEVVVTPESPLKIQYPARFSVSSSPTKRYSVNVFRNEERFRFSVTALPEDFEGQFAATIRYGRYDLVYKATCQVR